MPEPGAGRLVLVVGPSGAGKDTLIRAAREALAADARFCFPRRVVTRVAMAELEDHDSLDRAGFEAARATGAFALTWEAHGLRYALPGAIDEALAAGRVVVANGARRALDDALRRYSSARVVVVTATAEVRARRLAARGRETAAEIAQRLHREGDPVPPGVRALVVDNSGDLERGVAAFLRALHSFRNE